MYDSCCYLFFFFNDTATTEIYTLSLHDALPIYSARRVRNDLPGHEGSRCHGHQRSEEHTSELQSRFGISYAVFCLQKKTKNSRISPRERSTGGGGARGPRARPRR